jgi:RNA polymerase sigma-70 factor (ECF subfamily)
MAIDVAAWYEQYGPMVIRRCRKILTDGDDALDAAHDVFANLLREKTRLHGQFPSSLLYTMATNVCLNRIRKRKREMPWDFSGEESLFSANDEGFAQAEAKMLLEEILKDESETNRAIYYMHYADGMTLQEIGEAAGLSISGARKRLEAFKSRAQLKLRFLEEL